MGLFGRKLVPRILDSRPGLQLPVLAFAVVSTNHTVAIVIGVQLNHYPACSLKTRKHETAVFASPCIDQVLDTIRQRAPFWRQV